MLSAIWPIDLGYMKRIRSNLDHIGPFDALELGPFGAIHLVSDWPSSWLTNLQISHQFKYDDIP